MYLIDIFKYIKSNINVSRETLDIFIKIINNNKIK